MLGLHVVIVRVRVWVMTHISDGNDPGTVVPLAEDILESSVCVYMCVCA